MGLVINPDVPGDITITPLAGWDFGQPGPIVIPREDAIRPEGFNPTSDLGEAEGHFCTLEVHTNDVHIGKMDATVVAEDVIAMYAVPDRYAIVSDAASYEGDIDGTHLQTATYSGCAICGQPEDSETRYVAWIDIDWTASASGITTNSAVWTGPMAKGGHPLPFAMHAEWQACGASTGGTAAGGATVYELSIDLPDEYLGLNLTGAMKGKYVTRTATAKVDPAPPKVEYAWSDCGRCEWRSVTTRENVTYGATDKTGPSSSYRAEPLTVGATVTKGDLSASANCTTNFTVVKVDVKLEGTTEEDEESKRPEIYYIAEEQDEILSATGFKELKALSVSCKPENLPEPNAVSLLASSGARIYEITEDGKTSLVTNPCPCGEIGKKKFGVHGHSVSELKDWGEVIYAKNNVSQATDSCRVKVVQPPKLEITDLKFLSPAKDGGWPYDPIWDDPSWSASVDGHLSVMCSKNDDVATVRYALSRDAKSIEVKICENGLFGDVIALLSGGRQAGANEAKWIIPWNIPTETYVARVEAVDIERGDLIKRCSNEGNINRGDYYISEAEDVEILTDMYTITLSDVTFERALSKVTGIVVISGTAVVVAGGAVVLSEAEITAAALAAARGGVAATVAAVGTDWLLTLTGALDIPPWVVKGMSVYDKTWKVDHCYWNGSRGDYDSVLLRQPNLVPGSVIHSHVNGRFNMGYKAYAKKGLIEPGHAFTYGNLLYSKDGYYSEEVERLSIGDDGYKLGGWNWKAKPYGLIAPKIVYGHEQK